MSGGTVALPPESVRRIVIRANNWIGDVVMISPAVRALREHFQVARITIVAKPWVVEALSGNPYFDERVIYDPDGAHRGAMGRLRLARTLRRGGPIDLAVLFQKAFDAAVLAVLSGARVRVGYATDARRALLTHPLPPPPTGRHFQEAFLDLTRALGCPVRDPLPFFHLSDDERSAARALLERRRLARAPLRVALHPGASKAPRAWHRERFAELARRLSGRQGACFVLLGGPEDSEILRAIAAACPEGTCLGPEDAPTLRAAAALLETCDLFIGNDSGPMHLAAALGVPTVGIFGPGSPRTSGPRGRAGRVVVLGRDYPCSPCRQAFFRECRAAPSGKPFCLEEIGVDEVERASLGLWAATRVRDAAGAPPPEQPPHA